jgi:hypothetical protein
LLQFLASIVPLVLALSFPLGIYCLILGALNRRERPLLVSGPWDFAGVLLAVSGFLLFVGPAVLSSLYERWRLTWVTGQAGDEGPSGISYSLWVSLWYVYYVAVVAAALWMLKRRREITAVYNIEVATLEVALARVMERLGRDWRRAGNYFILKPQALAADNGDASALELESFPALHHATLRWRGVDEPSRQAIERELANVLDGMPTTPNPAAGWFYSIGASLMLVTLAGAAYLILINLRLLHL